MTQTRDSVPTANDQRSRPLLRGVLSPVVTPFKPDLAPDPARFVAHCRWLLGNGCDGLAIFGTNSEANSMTVQEKIDLLDALLDAGIDPARLMPGTGACAIGDAVAMTRHAVGRGCAGVLMLPPFYYKGVPDDGLARHFGEVIERVGDASLRVYLYHIPPVAQVGISLDLIARLRRDFPQTVVGIKDSSGDWNNTRAMLERFGADGFQVFAGSEDFLLANLRHGGVGCITATGNVNPGAIANLYRTWQDEGADERQRAISQTRSLLQKFPMIPALKATIAHCGDDPAWAAVRPPLQPLTGAQAGALRQSLADHGFSMPGLRGAAA
jgi:4-hydroxy-tetrahydrodipicolinate synthase